MSGRYRPRIVIADDHTLVAEACKGLLEGEFDIVGIVSDGRALIDYVSRANRSGRSPGIRASTLGSMRTNVSIITLPTK